METEFSKLNISVGDSSHKNCSYCNKPFIKELWCKECDPFRIMEGWTSGNPDIDKFIKDTMYNERDNGYRFLEWVPFNRFTNVKNIAEGGFSKVYSAIWIDGRSEYRRIYNRSWQRKEPKPKKIALKKLNGSQNMSDKYLNEVCLIFTIFLI
jgi:hypothetical protein